jgi:hypothetical protein
MAGWTCSKEIGDGLLLAKSEKWLAGRRNELSLAAYELYGLLRAEKG